MVSTAISSVSPFYRQLIVKEVKPLSRKYVGELLSRHADISVDAVDEIYCFSGGIPFYVQFLGKTLQYYNEKQDLDLIKKIEEDFLREEGGLLFREEFNYLSSKEKQIIVAIAKGNRRLSEIKEAVQGEISNVNTFLGYLEEKGYVLRQEKACYVICDPPFCRWLAGR